MGQMQKQWFLGEYSTSRKMHYSVATGFPDMGWLSTKDWCISEVGSEIWTDLYRWRNIWYHMEVSWNRGTPILMGFSLISHPFLGTSILGNPRKVVGEHLERQGAHTDSSSVFAGDQRFQWPSAMKKREEYDLYNWFIFVLRWLYATM